MNSASLPLLNSGTVWMPASRGDRYLVASHWFREEPRVRELEATHVSVLSRCDGGHAPAAIAMNLDVPALLVEHHLQWWEAEAPAALLFTPPDVGRERALRARAAAEDLIADWRTAQATSTSTVDFHRERLTDPGRNFERQETTISFVLAEPHPLLDGQRYGARVADRLIDRTGGGLRILEIGPGLGLLAAAFLDRVAETAPQVYARLTYTLMDVSPASIAAQKSALRDHAARTRWIDDDAETAAFDAERFDLILCNEVIADLTVDFANRAHIDARDPQTAAERTILEYGLPYAGAPERFVVNTGAIRLLERLAHWLAPAGRAWIVEYGARADFPKAVALAGHVEYSIRFDHLTTAAGRLGLEARCEPLGRWLNADERIEVMRADDATATAELLMPALGLPQPTRPWLVTRERLREWLGDAAPSLGHRGFFPVAGRTEGLAPSAFFALTVRQKTNRRTGEGENLC